MVRNFGERRKKRRGQSKKPKTKAPKTPSKSDQDVPQEPITCREMVVYVPKDTDAQQQQKPRSSERVQGQRNCLLARNPHRHQERNCREGGRFFIDDDNDGDDNDWEDVDDEDVPNDLEEMMLDHMLHHMLFQMMSMSMTFTSVEFNRRGIRVRQTPLFPGFPLSFFMRH